MYNQERKEKFITDNNHYTDPQKYKRRVELLFQNTEETEKKLAKDICDFSHSEILDFYKTLATYSLDMLVVTNNTLNTYASWCLKNKYIVDGLNHYSEISIDLLSTCINYAQQKKLFVSRTELLQEINEFINPYEQVAVLGLYEGLDILDLQNLTLEDVDFKNCKVNLHSGRALVVSKELSHYIEESVNTYVRHMKDGKELKLQDLCNKKQVIKNFHKSVNNDQEHRTLQFFNIMKRIKTNYGYPWLSAANLPQIGSANMLLEFWEKEKETSSIEEVANRHIEEIRLYYGEFWSFNKRFRLKYGFVYE